MLPPAIAPTQVVIVPIAQHKEGVLDKANELKSLLTKNFRVKLDDSDKSPGWKFSEHEMRGIPLRVELGPKDIEQNQAVLVRRDNGEKTIINLDKIEEKVTETIAAIQSGLLEKARNHRDENTFKAKSMNEFEKTIVETPGFIKAMWCGDTACEEAIKEKTGATARCIPFEQEKIGDTCICCSKPAEKMVYFARAY